jgi:16S rRNA (cytidine1402-2'-O)-methyltransferase
MDCAARPHGTLSLVSLPIGDPDDITLRALRVLREVSLIVSEDVRAARMLLDRLQIETETVSMRARKGVPAHTAALARLSEGRDVALVVDAGTPALVDPGLPLIQAAILQGHRITAVPGATACFAALLVSGMAVTPFCFLGFPPRRDPKRTEFFDDLAAADQTIVLYESPRYMRSLLSELARRLGNSRKIVVACDLTHTNERIFRGTILAASKAFASGIPAGAYALVVSGEPDTP